MSFILAVANQKGGVGKTTSAVNIAAALASKKRTVVLVDLDPQGNATSSLGIDKDGLKATVFDVLEGNAHLSDVVQKTVKEGLFVVPARGDLAQSEVNLVAWARREFILRAALESVAADIVIIDCPPALGLLTINALTSADGVLIPVQAEYFALEGLGQLVQTIQLVRKGLNPDLEIFGVLLTMYSKRMVLSEQVHQELKNHFGDTVFQVVVPRNIRLAEAPSFGKTIFEHDKWSKGARAYKAVASEVAKRAKV